MGAIYLGKKLGAVGFEKEVVLKQLLPEFTERPEFRDLFFREAKISASLDHNNIVRTFDLVASEDSLFIVMEYVRGADLRTISWRARLKRRALSPSGVLHVALEILAGLAYAHGKRAQNGTPLGIIHRDVSPSNILCSAQGEVKLSDFGIAKATTFSSVFYRVRGKVGYMSPEQAGNRSLDARSDLFSLAVCIMETLTGERLYAGDLQTPPEVIYAQEVPRLSAKRPDLPPELESIMSRALEKDPDRRYQDARAFAEALRDLTRRHGLFYSAPQLAEELRDLLGPNIDAWSHDDNFDETDRLPLGKTLVGKEAASLGVVEGPVAETDQGGPDTVSLRPPKGVSPPPTLPALPVVAPVERTLTPALMPPPVDPDMDVEMDTGRLGDVPLPLARRVGAPVTAAMPAATPAAPAPIAAATVPGSRSPAISAAPRSPRRKRWVLTMYVLLIGAGTLAGVWWARRRLDVDSSRLPGVTGGVEPAASVKSP